MLIFYIVLLFAAAWEHRNVIFAYRYIQNDHEHILEMQKI